MKIHTYSNENIPEDAYQKWHEYVAARKKTGEKVYADLARVYNQIKNGVKVIDIHETLDSGGFNFKTKHPNLAVTLATIPKVYFKMFRNGEAVYSSNQLRSNKQDVYHKFGLFDFPDPGPSPLRLTCSVPKIPFNVVPATGLKDYHYILWEVDEWTMMPSADPYLLRRLSPNMFAVLAGWQLTKLEIAVMKGRI